MIAHAHPRSPAFAWLEQRADRFAIGLSGLCAVHCVATSLLLVVAASAGSLLLNPLIHEGGLTLAMLIGAVALGRGVLRHGAMLPAVIGSAGLGTMAGALSLHHEHGSEALWTILGVGMLALGHELNRRATC